MATRTRPRKETEATQGTRGTEAPNQADNDGFIPPHSGFENLLSYQKALVVYQATKYFCNRFFDKKDRTVDQMVQAARSGKQNIIEASEASATSKETELKLTNVARASQAELLEDYKDLLRDRKIKEWATTHPYAQRLRQLVRTPNADYEAFRRGIEHNDPAISADVIIGLIKATHYLLDRQLERLERDFLAQGGLRERMLKARVAARAKQKKTT